jgi:hypothetical protein
MVLVALGGAAYVAFVNVPMPTVSIYGPTMPWFVNDQECEYPSVEKSLWNYDWGGKEPGLSLCFIASDNGKIPYAVAPTPPEEKARRERVRADNRARMARGEPPTIMLDSPWFYTANEFDPRVQAYVDKSAADLKTPEVRQRLNDTHWSTRWRAHNKAFEEAGSFVFGLLVFIWVFTAVMGWIVRGFAGVPSGQDFKPATKE